MHREPLQFVASVKRQAPEYFTGKKVLEVGSLDINGSVRQFFTDCDYTGIDLGEGPGVDCVARATKFKSMMSSFYGVIASTETLEHDKEWAESLSAMYRLLEPGGLLLITCAAPNRPEHGTTRTGSADASPFTSDYYRNISVEDFASVFPANLFSRSYLGYRGDMDDLYFAGIKHTFNTAAAAQMEINKRHFVLPLTVTAEISTKDRYETTLGLCIASIINQTRKPDRLVIYDDGEQKDLRTMPPFDGLLRMAVDCGMSLETFTTPREGQVKNHQHALDNAQTDVIFRCDDDLILEPNVIEECLKILEADEKVGAVAPLIHHPGGVSPLPSHVTGKLNDISLGLNLQWFSLNGSGPREVEHLYSSFAVRAKALKEAGGYPMNLSVVGHHEESIASHQLHRAGWKLIVTPHAKAHHLRQSTGGIRSYSDTSLWEHDEQVFQEYLKAWGVVQPDTKLLIIDAGIGDHLLAKAVLPQIRKAHKGKKLVLAVCYESVFEDVPDIEIISIAAAKLIVGDKYGDYSIYQYCWNNNLTQPLADSMVEFWSK